MNLVSFEIRRYKEVDRGKMEFTLEEDLKAYKYGFQRIPFEKIGSRKDSFLHSPGLREF